MLLLHSLRFGRVLLSEVGILDSAEIVGLSIDCCGRISDVGEGRECLLLPKVLFPIGRRVGEDDQVLFVIGYVRSTSQTRTSLWTGLTYLGVFPVFTKEWCYGSLELSFSNRDSPVGMSNPCHAPTRSASFCFRYCLPVDEVNTPLSVMSPTTSFCFSFLSCLTDP